MSFGESVVRVRRGAQTGEDRYGQPVYGAAAETTIEGAAFDPGGSVEPVEVGRTPVITTPRVYFPDGSPDIVPTDRLRVRGVLYAVTGRPAAWVYPWSGATSGTVVELEAVEG